MTETGVGNDRSIHCLCCPPPSPPPTAAPAAPDAGDGLDDANFVVSVVNAQILKLTKEIDWVKEALALAKAGELRTLSRPWLASSAVVEDRPLRTVVRYECWPTAGLGIEWGRE